MFVTIQRNAKMWQKIRGGDIVFKKSELCVYFLLLKLLLLLHGLALGMQPKDPALWNMLLRTGSTTNEGM